MSSMATPIACPKEQPMKRKTKMLTIRVTEDVADKVARLRELEHGLVTRLVTKAILDYKETDNEQA